jgi:hypothetical protein
MFEPLRFWLPNLVPLTWGNDLSQCDITTVLEPKMSEAHWSGWLDLHYCGRDNTAVCIQALFPITAVSAGQ